jgi:protein-arginine kinase activator protein McsA
MTNTIDYHTENFVCEECKTNPAQHIHVTTLSKNKLKKLCKTCFKKLIDKQDAK